jgi:hypothetical protein
MKLEDILWAIKAHRATLITESVTDTNLVNTVATALSAYDIQSGIAGSESFAIAAAVDCIQAYRRMCRKKQGESYVENIPVRKAVMAGDGGGRFYWRLATKDGAYLTIVKDGLVGTVQIARRKAMEHYIEGLEITELVPPDIDPQGPDERQLNKAKQQEPGLTVRMREKKT